MTKTYALHLTLPTWLGRLIHQHWPTVIQSCCQVPTNLVAHRERPDLVIRKCAVCGCRHFELTVDTGRLGLVGVKV